MKTQITIEQLAEKLDKTVWSAGNLKRIYLNDAGYNTKKMKTKTFIFQNEKGEFKVNCKIDCQSQPDSWIDSQEQEVRDSVFSKIEQAIYEIENPDGDFEQYKENLEIEAEQQAEIEASQEKSEKAIAVENLNLYNVNDFIRKYYDYGKHQHGSTMWYLNYHNWQLRKQSGFLNEKDEYAPFIHTSAFERRYLKGIRPAESFEDKIGVVRVGESNVEFDDIVRFDYIGKCGNGHNKNAFKATTIPTHVIEKLNDVLEAEKVARTEHLKNQVEYYTEKLSEYINKLKSEKL